MMTSAEFGEHTARIEYNLKHFRVPYNGSFQMCRKTGTFRQSCLRQATREHREKCCISNNFVIQARNVPDEKIVEMSRLLLYGRANKQCIVLVLAYDHATRKSIDIVYQSSFASISHNPLGIFRLRLGHSVC